MSRKKDAAAARPGNPDPTARIADAGAEAPLVEPAPEVSSFPIVGIGASAGGLEAFTLLLRALPLDTGMGFVLVQHLDPEHESALTQILSRATSLPVSEVVQDERVEPNHVYVIPPNTSLSIKHGVLQLERRTRTRTPHRPIDSFFEALAEDQQGAAIGVVLSGTATDGTLGLEAIKAEGGITFAQDDSAKHDSMPRSAVAAGCVDLIMTPAAIAQELARIARHPYVAAHPVDLPTHPEGDRAADTEHADDATPLTSERHGSPSIGADQAHAEAAPGGDTRGRVGAGALAETSYKQILIALRNHSGVDFSLYKSATMQRRVNRRVVLSQLETLDEYARFLKGNPQELDALYSDVLISVTSFFRNPEMFEALKHEILPRLLRQKTDDPIRVWVLGCSTGQEAYSIAMTFAEAEAEAPAPQMRRLQVFATDLNGALLDKARHGLYARNLAQDLSPERLRRFFVEEDGGYRVTKMLREMVVFSRQNLISDPPFSRLDLISCRNLLIYLEPSLQKRAMPTFHYALKPGGYLLLGASESIGGFSDLFVPVDKRWKIYARKDAPIQAPHPTSRLEQGTQASRAALPPLPMRRAELAEPSAEPRDEFNAQREADRITVSKFAPPGVLINSDLQVLQFRGLTGAYLEPPAGKATFDVLKMAREGLMLPLRAALQEARKDMRVARRDKVRIRQDGLDRTVNLEVIPLRNLREPCFLILFGEADGIARDGGRGTRPALDEPAAAVTPSEPRQESGRIAELEGDLAETRDYLQSIQEEHEASHEELQAASEEIQSANEELQSVNEELETSKEELESANEELITVNDEMNHRNLELNLVNNDLINLQTSSRLAVVLLGRDLVIRRFSPQAEKQFELLAGDIGRPINQLRLHLTMVADSASGGEVPIEPGALAAEVIASVREQECEVRDRAGRWHSLRVRPYLTLDNRVDGAVLVLVDIDELKRSEQAVGAARDLAEQTIATVREPLLVLDSTFRVESANASFYRNFETSPAETLGKVLFELGASQWDIPRLRELLEAILPMSSSIEDFELERDFGPLGTRTLLLNARRVVDPGLATGRILLAIEDVTVRRHTEDALRTHRIELQAQVDELNRFNEMAVGRELRMIELKQEINALCRRHGEPPPFSLDFEPASADREDQANASRREVDEAGNEP